MVCPHGQVGEGFVAMRISGKGESIFGFAVLFGRLMDSLLPWSTLWAALIKWNKLK